MLDTRIRIGSDWVQVSCFNFICPPIFQWWCAYCILEGAFHKKYIYIFFILPVENQKGSLKLVDQVLPWRLPSQPRTEYCEKSILGALQRCPHQLISIPLWSCVHFFHPQTRGRTRNYKMVHECVNFKISAAIVALHVCQAKLYFSFFLFFSQGRTFEKAKIRYSFVFWRWLHTIQEAWIEMRL